MQLSKLIKEAINIFAIPLSNKINRLIVPPSIVGFNLTKRCNSRCTMCHFWKHKYNPDEELSIDVISAVLKDLKKLGVRYVSYAAEGEIFTRKDICEIFSVTKELGLEFAINTNGLTLPDDFVQNIHNLTPYTTVFGLDTTNPDAYAQIRGIPNGYDRVISSIKKLKSANYHSISIGSVILNNNLDQLLRLSGLALTEGLNAVRFTAFSPVGFGINWKKEDLKMYSDPEYLQKLNNCIEDLINHKHKYGIISNSTSYLKEIPNYYKSNFNYLPYDCLVGYYNIQIMANGDVPVCSYRGKSSILGNIKETSIIDMWYSEKAAAERLNIKNRHCPTCWLSCFAENNMRFSLNKMIPNNYEAFKRSFNLNFK